MGGGIFIEKFKYFAYYSHAKKRRNLIDLSMKKHEFCFQIMYLPSQNTNIAQTAVEKAIFSQYFIKTYNLVIDIQ